MDAALPQRVSHRRQTGVRDVAGDVHQMPGGERAKTGGYSLQHQDVQSKQHSSANGEDRLYQCSSNAWVSW